MKIASFPTDGKGTPRCYVQRGRQRGRKRAPAGADKSCPPLRAADKRAQATVSSLNEEL